jgi:hypothetical protein
MLTDQTHAQVRRSLPCGPAAPDRARADAQRVVAVRGRAFAAHSHRHGASRSARCNLTGHPLRSVGRRRRPRCAAVERPAAAAAATDAADAAASPRADGPRPGSPLASVEEVPTISVSGIRMAPRRSVSLASLDSLDGGAESSVDFFEQEVVPPYRFSKGQARGGAAGSFFLEAGQPGSRTDAWPGGGGCIPSGSARARPKSRLHPATWFVADAHPAPPPPPRRAGGDHLRPAAGHAGVLERLFRRRGGVGRPVAGRRDGGPGGAFAGPRRLVGRARADLDALLSAAAARGPRRSARAAAALLARARRPPAPPRLAPPPSRYTPSLRLAPPRPLPAVPSPSRPRRAQRWRRRPTRCRTRCCSAQSRWGMSRRGSTACSSPACCASAPRASSAFWKPGTRTSSWPTRSRRAQGRGARRRVRGGACRALVCGA